MPISGARLARLHRDVAVEFRFRDTRRVSRACRAEFLSFLLSQRQRLCDSLTGRSVELAFVVYHSLFVKAAAFFHERSKARITMQISQFALIRCHYVNDESRIANNADGFVLANATDPSLREIPRRERNVNVALSFSHDPLGNRSRWDEFSVENRVPAAKIFRKCDDGKRRRISRAFSTYVPLYLSLSLSETADCTPRSHEAVFCESSICRRFVARGLKTVNGDDDGCATPRDRRRRHRRAARPSTFAGNQ